MGDLSIQFMGVLERSKAWSEDHPAILCALLIALALTPRAIARIIRRPRYAPGPRPLPLFGNSRDLKVPQPWKQFTRWKETYGDIIGLRMLGSHIVVLNSSQTIVDLLDKRGAKYAHRPISTVLGELMGLSKSMSRMDYGPRYRAARRLTHTALNPSAVKKYVRMQEDLAALLARDLLDTPGRFYELIRLTAGRVIIAIAYGIEVKTVDSKFITEAEDTMLMISQAAAPGAFLADLIPAMKYLPSWLPFQRKAARGREMIHRLVTRPFEQVKADLAAGTARPSLTRELLIENRNVMTLDMEDLIKWSVGALYGAGSETSYATTLVYLVAMALNPTKQSLGQQEIDTVLGGVRLPVINDRERLPYVDAIVKETMRWYPVVPLSVARRTAEHDVYNGYDIPKDTIVMPNAWAIAHEPNAIYPPEQFLPERFLDKEHPATDPSSWAFGWGRRICPGKQLGEANVFILISTILSAFTVSPLGDEPLNVTFRPGFISYPMPFKCRIIPRSAEIAELVRARAAQSTV